MHQINGPGKNSPGFRNGGEFAKKKKKMWSIAHFEEVAIPARLSGRLLWMRFVPRSAGFELTDR
jgi:hypothetical protein